MDPKAQKKIDEIMYETNEKISAIVNEIRDIRFSKMDENEKQTKCDGLRVAFEQVMIEEERKVETVMKECP
jgi:hypothetical protein